MLYNSNSNSYKSGVKQIFFVAHPKHVRAATDVLYLKKYENPIKS